MEVGSKIGTGTCRDGSAPDVNDRADSFRAHDAFKNVGGPQIGQMNKYISFNVL
jgi:hypothetical protein